MEKETKKARVNITLDEGLYKRMQLYSNSFGINWSQVIEQYLIPVVLSFEDYLAVAKEKGNKDSLRLKMVFQDFLSNILARLSERAGTLKSVDSVRGMVGLKKKARRRSKKK